jgi:DnaJ-class molecular chaperone
MKLKDGRARSSFDVVVNYTVPAKLTKKQEEILKEFKNTIENGN